MAKILNVNDMLEAGHNLADDGIADPVKIAELCAGLEASATALAGYLAEVTGVTVGSTDYQIDAGGLCATFYTGPRGETCDHLAAGDEGGEWEKARDDPSRATWADAEAAGYAVQAPHGEGVLYPASNTFTLPGGKPDPLKRTFVSAAYAREAATDHLEETR